MPLVPVRPEVQPAAATHHAWGGWPAPAAQQALGGAAAAAGKLRGALPTRHATAPLRQDGRESLDLARQNVRPRLLRAAAGQVQV